MDTDKTVTANFIQISYTLTIAVSGNGTTTPSVGPHNYTPGTVVNISATPADGWQFVNWTGSVADPNSPNTTATMDTDKTVTANFIQTPATFGVSDLTITPAEVAVGQRVYGSVLVTNSGGTTGSYQVTLKINGEIITTATITLAGGSSVRLGYSVMQRAAGTFTVDVNGLTGTFVVR
jgi:hypothetical protein